MDLKTYLDAKRAMVEEALERRFPAMQGPAALLTESMRYSLLAGGKRLRPILHLASVEAVGGDPDACMGFACALEMIHTYSLIHDDLPSMDNDELRRGKPTNHVIYGEAMALLAGDALLTEAFRVIAQESLAGRLDPKAVLRATLELAQAAGAQGMVGGQAVDILSEGKPLDPDTLVFIHTHKTAALIRASLTTGAILGGAGQDELDRLARYGECLGLAFQIRDDLLNEEGDPKRLGKAIRTDRARGKATYPGLFGIQGSRDKLKDLAFEAIGCLELFGSEAQPLREIALYVVERDH
ncbi:MAG: polyprenyl synthetase family protein [Thermodesulfobacteriota bacterium]